VDVQIGVCWFGAELSRRKGLCLHKALQGVRHSQGEEGAMKRVLGACAPIWETASGRMHQKSHSHSELGEEENDFACFIDALTIGLAAAAAAARLATSRPVRFPDLANSMVDTILPPESPKFLGVCLFCLSVRICFSPRGNRSGRYLSGVCSLQALSRGP